MLGMVAGAQFQQHFLVPLCSLLASAGHGMGFDSANTEVLRAQGGSGSEQVTEGSLR